MKLYDLFGKDVNVNYKMVDEALGFINIAIETKYLSKGIYFLHTTIGDKSYNNKIIVQ